MEVVGGSSQRFVCGDILIYVETMKGLPKLLYDAKISLVYRTLLIEQKNRPFEKTNNKWLLVLRCRGSYYRYANIDTWLLMLVSQVMVMTFRRLLAASFTVSKQTGLVYSRRIRRCLGSSTQLCRRCKFTIGCSVHIMPPSEDAGRADSVSGPTFGDKDVVASCCRLCCSSSCS